MHTKLLPFTFILLAAFCTVAPCVAEEAAAEKEKKDEPTEELRTGTIANFGNYQRRAAINSASEAVPSDALPNPISGSIKRTKGEQCVATLSNNSKEYSYTIHYKVVGIDGTGNKAFARSYSASLKPGATDTRDIQCRKGLNMAVEIISGKQRK